MSNTTLPPYFLARATAFVWAAAAVGFEKWVPVTTMARLAGDQRFVDIAFIQRHVSAVGAIEDGRGNALGLHGEQHQSGEPILVDVNSVDGDALANKLFANEAAHLFCADARDQGRLESEPRSSDRDVGRTTAHGFRETSQRPRAGFRSAGHRDRQKSDRWKSHRASLGPRRRQSFSASLTPPAHHAHAAVWT